MTTPKPAAIVITAGADQSADVDAVLPARIAVRVNDAAGNTIPGVVVTFKTVSGGAVIDGATQVTDANGVATVGNVTLGPTPTTTAIVATVGDLSSPVISATAKWSQRLSAGGSGSCAIVPVGRTQCWGDGARNQLGVTVAQLQSPPVRASASPIASVTLAGLTMIGASTGLGFCGATTSGWALAG